MRRSEVCSRGKEVRDCQGGDDVQLHHLRWDQSPGFSTPVSLALSEGPMSCPKYVEKETKAYSEEKAQMRYPFAVWR